MIQNYKQFILWKLVGIKDKVPCDPRGNNINPHDPKNWMTYDEAKSHSNKIGFVFTATDPFFFIDIDKCLQSDNTWSPLAVDLCQRFAGATVEVSQSGTGLHIIGTGTVPEHSCKRADIGLEFYTQDRFVALTGDGVGSDTVFTDVLQSFAGEYFLPHAATGNDNVAAWSTTHDSRSSPISDDLKLIETACKSKSTANKFGQGITFEQLYCADVEALVDTYPVNEPRADGLSYDVSLADASLAQRLAFWTGNNCERMDHLMRQSDLFRTKWDKHKSYLRNTILAACAKQDQFFGTPITETSREGFQYLTADAQREYFKGMTYIIELDRIFTPSGMLLNQSRFNAAYAGYVFQLDSTGDKTTRKPWEAFTESQCIHFPKVENETFRPDLEPGTVVSVNGDDYLNSYIDVNIKMIDGDVSMLTDYMQRLLPDAGDRSILLAYMAACVQHRGVKFQWAPLIQGVEGNGKTALSRIVSYAIGEKYTHFPDAGEISEKYNKWLFRKLFIGVEDVYVPEHKREVIEKLKPMITNDRLAMRAMQQDQVMGNNYANFILNSNHKNAIAKHKNDRRFAIFFTAQQDVEDLERDGMNGDFFPKLYAWLRGDGYAIVAKWLNEYKIPHELNPASGCYRAPRTTATDEAILESLGSVEQEIIEAVESGLPGFCGGWISSLQLDKLLRDKRMEYRVNRNKRKDILKSLGYIPHPVLNGGRTHNPIPFDGGKPILYIKQDGILSNIHSVAEASRIYQQTQIQNIMGGSNNVQQGTV